MKFSRQLALAAVFSAAATAPIAGNAFPIAAVGTEGLSVVVGNTGNIIATYQGNSASYSNDLLLSMTAVGTGLDGNNGNDTYIFNNHATPVGTTFNLGSFAVGTELIFRLHVNNTGNDFFTGLASRNADNKFHARVENNWQPNETLVSFEDLFGTPEGINGYNDLSFSFTNTIAAPTPTVPEPVSLSLIGLGLAGLGMSRRKKTV